MDPSSISLVAFSSALVVVSAAYIFAVNYRRCCKPRANTQSPIDWANDIVSQNAAS